MFVRNMKLTIAILVTFSIMTSLFLYYFALNCHGENFIHCEQIILKLNEHNGFKLTEFVGEEIDGGRETLFNLGDPGTLNKGLVMDLWHDLCFTSSELKELWYPLFPRFPDVRTVLADKAGEEKGANKNVLRRIYGFLRVDVNEDFRFKLLSRGGAEMALIDTTLLHERYNFNEFLLNLERDTTRNMTRLMLNRRIFLKQYTKVGITELFFVESKNVQLIKDRLYFIEIAQGGKSISKFKLQWRTNKTKYETIPAKNLLYDSNLGAVSILKKKVKILPILEFESRRNKFHELPVLNASDQIKKANTLCTLTNKTYVKINNYYEGYRNHVEPLVSYPKEYFKFIGVAKTEQLLLDEKEAIEIVANVFNKLNGIYDYDLILQQIVHVQKNLNLDYQSHSDWKKTFYLVEFDVKRNSEDKMYRFSYYVRYSPSTGICFDADYTWQENVTLNIITTVYNEVKWLKYHIHMISNILKTTNEKNVKLVIVDCGSTDGNYELILKNGGVPYKYLRMETENFSKVKALNYALSNINDGGIGFVVDLNLHLPLNIFDRVRKSTIKGRTAFIPTLLNLGCGEYEGYTSLRSSEWLDIGTGMLGMYISDFMNVGGYNTVMFNDEWGGEDWEIIDRIVSNGIYIIHYRLPRFYHIYHTKKGHFYRHQKDRLENKNQTTGQKPQTRNIPE